MLNKLLFKNQDYRQLIIAAIGGILGLMFMMGSIHFLIRIDEFGEGSEILGSNNILIQKNKTFTDNIDFTPEEIMEFKNHYSVEVLQPVQNNNFRVYLEEKRLNKSLDAFIQSIPREFMSSNKKEWEWSEISDEVPIIMPRDFLIMLNTYLSASEGMQISEEEAKNLKLNLIVSKNRKYETRKARIIGFTNELSGLLVPEEFMNYATNKFANGKKGRVTQLFLKSKQGMFGELEKYIKSKNYLPKESQMVIARLNSFVKAMIYLILVISISAVFGAILILIQYIQLLIFYNKYEIKTLLNLGYSIDMLVKRFVIYFSKLFILISFLSVGLLYLLKSFINELFFQAGIFIESTLSEYVFLVVLLTFLLFFTVSYMSAKKTIKKQFINYIG